MLSKSSFQKVGLDGTGYRSGSMMACIAGAVLGGVLAVSATASASPLFFQGFEQNTSGWVFGSTSSQATGAYGITRYASWSSSSPYPGISAASGSYYAVVSNNTNNYSETFYSDAGYGDGGFATFGLANGDPTYPGTFSQSMSIYVEPNWAKPTVSGNAAFWLDGAPSASAATGNGGQPLFGGAGYGGVGVGSAENDFAFFANGSSVTVAADDSTKNSIATISTAGWYTFVMTYSQGANHVHETLSILDNSGNLLAGETPQIFDYTSIPNADLGGPNYLWLTVWQNGFANNALAIDNVEATPEPAAMGLLGAGALGLLALRKRRASQ